MHIAVLGCGNMGRAIINGVLADQPHIKITAYDKEVQATDLLPDVVTVKDPNTWFDTRDLPRAILLAVKPQDIQTACAKLAADAGERAKNVLWISIAAGVSVARLSQSLGKEPAICRVMPNAPALIGEGISAYALNRFCGPEDAQVVENIMGSCGKVISVAENLLDAVTGLSGSGPAYVFKFIEALIEGGITAGLSAQTARECAVQTVIGAAKMVQQTEAEPAKLKHQVMSPGGTTTHGLLALEKNNFAFSVMQAVLDATKRSRELG